uniref:Mediator of RNA polymerase II transcription subunit 17 n=3 Tax=Rhizophora mucronata TaxID=61149 RepID=A0A2P2K931_RHIMU
MESSLRVSLDKLPLKRLDAIEENGSERFPTDSDVGYDEERVSLIRRIDFAWAVEKEDEKEGKKKTKQKKSSKESSSTAPWPWQSMVENLQLAHQELSVIFDLINTVEANDSVTVASMTNPKQLPKEILSDLAVSTATKLQCYRHLGKYFKQSAKALEQQVTREAKFYGALIRLQQNWKVKRQRVAATASSSEGFTIDLFDSSLHSSAPVYRPSSLSSICIDHNSAGMLAINLPPNSCHSLHFGFLGVHSNDITQKSSRNRTYNSVELPSKETEKESLNENDCVQETHSLLREVHRSIFDEQVFDMVNREAFNSSLGVNVTGIRENYLQLGMGPGNSVFVSLVSSKDDERVEEERPQNLKYAVFPLDSLDGVKIAEENSESFNKKSVLPNFIIYEIYLKQIFHEYVFVRAKDRPTSTAARVSGQPTKDGPGLLGHFCMSLAHRIFSNKVLTKLENVVCGVSYLHLISHPTWHSRISSWTIFMKVPRSILPASSQTQASDIPKMKNITKTEFRTKIVVNDDSIKVEAEGAPNVVGLLKGSSENVYSTNKYDCDLASLPVIVLQQVASQVVRWLHEEALKVGIKANRDFLCLSFKLEQGEIVSLVAHVDPEDTEGCISWWLVMEEGYVGERKLHMDVANGASECKKFLGYLTLDVLYSTLIDLVTLCGGSGTF